MLLPMRGIVSTPLPEPLLLQVFTCGAMRHSPPSTKERAEAALAEAAFKQMDKGGRGKLSKRDLLPSFPPSASLLPSLSLSTRPPIPLPSYHLTAPIGMISHCSHHLALPPSPRTAPITSHCSHHLAPASGGGDAGGAAGEGSSYAFLASSAVPQFPLTPTPIARPYSLPHVLSHPSPVPSRRPCFPVASPPFCPAASRRPSCPAPSASRFPSSPVTRAPCALPIRHAPTAPCLSVASCAPCPSVVPPLRPARPLRPVRLARPRVSRPSLPVASVLSRRIVSHALRKPFRRLGFRQQKYPPLRFRYGDP
ncbi:unnamed protein product [Closterium sp. Naga37s-1]|nr:unnamed protein product [Closterium sp. Naga37s-1]